MQTRFVCGILTPRRFSTQLPFLMYVSLASPRLISPHSPFIYFMLTWIQGGGIQDVKFIPGNPESAALATAVHLGQVWIVYPLRKDENGNQGTTELLYDLGEKARDTVAI